MINEQQAAHLVAINILLSEAYHHYFTLSDGYCKSSEGHVSVGFGNYWERADKDPAALEVHISSYVFGPNRNNTYASTGEALEAVQEWHRIEMGTVYDENGDWVSRPDGPDGAERRADADYRWDDA